MSIAETVAPAKPARAAKVAPSGGAFAALAAQLGVVETEAASAAPTLENPARVGAGRSVGVAVDGDTLILVMNIAEARLAGLLPRLKKDGKPAKSVTIAEAGGFRPIALGFGGLKLNLWLGRDAA